MRDFVLRIFDIPVCSMRSPRAADRDSLQKGRPPDLSVGAIRAQRSRPSRELTSNTGVSFMGSCVTGQVTA